MNNGQNSNKKQKQNLYVTVAVILMMVTVVIAIAFSLAKNAQEGPVGLKEATETTADTLTPGKDEAEAAPPAEDVFLEENDGENSESDKVSVEEEKENNVTDTKEEEEEKNEEAAANALPVFVSPVRGEVQKGVSLEMPVFSKTMEDYRTHTGVDLYCESATDVACAADGRIVKIWDDPMMGMSITVEHSGNAQTTYQNLYDELPLGIEEGKEVKAGEIIATAGNTALEEVAEESHLHFEMTINGEYVDPAEYVEFAKTSTYEG